MNALAQVNKVTFDSFEMDLKTEELRRGTRRVRCQRQPFLILRTLIERSGQVVSRDELREIVWGSNGPSDGDHSLAMAINKLREALGDSAESPRFIETLSRRGYRFIAEVSLEFEPEPAPVAILHQVPVSVPVPDLELIPAVPPGSPLAEPAVPLGTEALPLQPSPLGSSIPPARHSPVRLNPYVIFALFMGAAVLAGFTLAHTFTPHGAAPRRVAQVTHNDRIFPGVPAMESFAVLASDGTRLYSSTLENGRTEITSIEPSTGDMARLDLPDEIENPRLFGISPDGSRLLVGSRLFSESEEAVWVVTREGGNALRVGNIRAHDAAWMPDGQSILYATGNDLDVIRLGDETTTHFATLAGRAFWMRWSPDGKLLRLTVIDPLSHTSSLWQIARGSGTPKRLLSGWTTPATECCGVWTADGQSYVFQSSHEEGADLWLMRGGLRPSTPEKLTNGPLLFTAPVTESSSHQVYFVGLDARSELQRFDTGLRHFVPERGFFADATRVAYSRDGQWVAWADGSGHLWRARAADGSEKVRLTPDIMGIFLAQWSPDGHHLLAMAREPGRSWQIFLVNADGGVPELLLPENRNQADPTWSPDGNEIAFGRTPDLMGMEDGPKQVEIFNLRTRKLQALPGSEGFFSPRWSPDGRWIAALTLGEQRLMLYNTATQTWTPVGHVDGADPVWAPDSSAIYIHTAFANPQTVEHVSIPDANRATIATLTTIPAESNRADYVFVGMAQGAPLVRVRTTTGNLYSLNLAP